MLLQMQTENLADPNVVLDAQNFLRRQGVFDDEYLKQRCDKKIRDVQGAAVQMLRSGSHPKHLTPASNKGINVTCHPRAATAGVLLDSRCSSRCGSRRRRLMGPHGLDKLGTLDVQNVVGVVGVA